LFFGDSESFRSTRDRRRMARGNRVAARWCPPQDFMVWPDRGTITMRDAWDIRQRLLRQHCGVRLGPRAIGHGADKGAQ